MLMESVDDSFIPIQQIPPSSCGGLLDSLRKSEIKVNALHVQIKPVTYWVQFLHISDQATGDEDSKLNKNHNCADT